MKVILFRHGPAEARNASRWPDDSERPLSRWGERRTRVAACGLKRFEGSVDRILTSPFKRADRTARILGQALGLKVETLDAAVPGGSPRKVIEAINGLSPAVTVVMVGHEPDLGALAALLVANGNGAFPLKKAGACAIEFDGPVRPGGGTLEWLAPPRLLCRVTRRKAAV